MAGTVSPFATRAATASASFLLSLPTDRYGNERFVPLARIFRSTVCFVVSASISVLASGFSAACLGALVGSFGAGNRLRRLGAGFAVVRAFVAVRAAGFFAVVVLVMSAS